MCERDRDALPLHLLYRWSEGLSSLETGLGAPLAKRREDTVQATVSEIHRYPLRPAGYAEPLFHCRESRREILDHLAESGWLQRASEASRPARPEQRSSEPMVSEPARGAPGRVIASWREVERWWEPDGGVDLVWCRVEDCRGRQTVLAEPPPAGSPKTA